MAIKRPVSKQPIPAHARRVFKGDIFDVYQWQQKLFDGTVATFEKIRRPDTVNVLPVTSEGKILLSEQEQPGGPPFIGSLGGRIDDGESPVEAARREMLEESGYQAKTIILWDAVQMLPKIDWAVYTFIAQGCRKVQEEKPDAGESIKLKLVTFTEFIDLVSKDNFRDVEIALKMFRVLKDPRKLDEARRLFGDVP